MLKYAYLLNHRHRHRLLKTEENQIVLLLHRLLRLQLQGNQQRK
jgi:hypothetical protein